MAESTVLIRVPKDKMDMGRAVFSEVFFTGNVGWEISVVPKKDGQAMIGVKCLGASGEPRTPWTASAAVHPTIRSQHGTEDTTLASIQHQFSRKVNTRFLGTELKLADLFDVESVFALENSFLLAVRIVLNRVTAAQNPKEETTFVGLTNYGASCFLNAFIQTIFCTDELRWAITTLQLNPVETREAELVMALREIVTQLESSDYTVSNRKFTQKLLMTSLDPSVEQDAQEFFEKLLEILLMTMKGTPAGDSISQLLTTSVQSFIRGVNVEFFSPKEELETYFDIPLHVQGKQDVFESLDDFVSTERLPRGYDIPGHGPQDIDKGSNVVSLADVLFFTLKRYEFTTGVPLKVNDRFVFYENINLDRFVPTGSKPANYVLKAVIVHTEIGNGHYIAYNKRGNDWYEFNDRQVRRVPRNQAVDMNFGRSGEKGFNAYMLRYEKVSLKEPHVCDAIPSKQGFVCRDCKGGFRRKLVDPATQEPAAKKVKLDSRKLHRAMGKKFLLQLLKSAKLPDNICARVVDLYDSADFTVTKFESLAAAALIVGMELWAKEELAKTLPGCDDDVDELSSLLRQVDLGRE